MMSLDVHHETLPVSNGGGRFAKFSVNFIATEDFACLDDVLALFLGNM